MAYRVAINGVGRIGRLTLRALLEKDLTNVEVVAINDLGKLESNLHLFKYDSIHGKIDSKIQVNDNVMSIDEHQISFFSNNPFQINYFHLKLIYLKFLI